MKDDDKQDHPKKVALHSFIFKNAMKTFDDLKTSKKVYEVMFLICKVIYFESLFYHRNMCFYISMIQYTIH